MDRLEALAQRLDALGETKSQTQELATVHIKGFRHGRIQAHVHMPDGSCGLVKDIPPTEEELAEYAALCDRIQKRLKDQWFTALRRTE